MQHYRSVGTTALVAMMEADRIASGFSRREALRPGEATWGSDGRMLRPIARLRENDTPRGQAPGSAFPARSDR